MIVALKLMYLITKQSQKVERACNRIHELERLASGSENALQNICWERGIRSRIKDGNVFNIVCEFVLFTTIHHKPTCISWLTLTLLEKVVFTLVSNLVNE